MSDSLEIGTLLACSPVIPVVTIRDVGDSVAIGEALLEGGVGIIEVTLRSAAGLDAIERLRSSCPGLQVGAGTVWSAAQAAAAADVGAQFIVSPGRADPVLDACRRLGLPHLPGAQTATEIARIRDAGLNAAKFFPAVPAGGIDALKAFAAVFPDMQFCPTGGLTLDTAPTYLALDCVPCVGGSWLAAPIATRDWEGVRAAARAAAALRSVAV